MTNEDDRLITLASEAHALRETTLEKIAAVELQRRRQAIQFRWIMGFVILLLVGNLFQTYANHHLVADTHKGVVGIENVVAFIQQINDPNGCYHKISLWSSASFRIDLENDNRLIHHAPLLKKPNPPVGCQLPK